ncbi:FAD:protein FMN transferase [Candidatus Nomurabacteria bacterium]|nr:MAG: FAD:protein FMN transferase [Candidatus Nomurabacteria bacterium]
MNKEYEFKMKAMGTECFISIISNDEVKAGVLGVQALNTIKEYEKKFSRFLPDSELSKLNEKKEMNVSREFMEVISEAFMLYKKTKGIFNPLVQIERFGYDKTYTELTPQDTPIDLCYDIDFDSVKIDIENNKITLADCQKLDFGGVLKGYLAEKIAQNIIENESVSGVIVNLGGDICTRGLDEHNRKFIFSIYNPVNPDKNEPVEIFNQSLATSGTYKRVWDRSGNKINHILNKSGTGNTDSGTISASIIHESGSSAEAFAKVFLSLPIKDVNVLFAESKIKYITITESGVVNKNI